MNRFMKMSLLVGAVLSVGSTSFCAPAQANDQQKYLDSVAVQMYANNVRNGMSPLTGGIYSPYVNGTLRSPNRNRRHRNNYNNGYYSNNYNNGYSNNYNNGYSNNDNNGYYNDNYGYQNYGYGNQSYGYKKPSVWSQLINGGGY